MHAVNDRCRKADTSERAEAVTPWQQTCRTAPRTKGACFATTRDEHVSLSPMARRSRRLAWCAQVCACYG